MPHTMQLHAQHVHVHVHVRDVLASSGRLQYSRLGSLATLSRRMGTGTVHRRTGADGRRRRPKREKRARVRRRDLLRDAEFVSSVYALQGTTDVLRVRRQVQHDPSA